MLRRAAQSCATYRKIVTVRNRDTLVAQRSKALEQFPKKFTAHREEDRLPRDAGHHAPQRFFNKNGPLHAVADGDENCGSGAGVQCDSGTADYQAPELEW